MATKKTAAAAEELMEETVKAEETQAEEPRSEWDIEKEILVPRKPKGDDPSYYVCINDRRFLIPADGRVQKLPLPVAIVLQESLEAEYKADQFADTIPNMA
jgi:hypothetical protein